METIDIQIKSNIPEATNETKSLKQQVKDLKKEMEACEVGSDDYADALVRLAKATHDLKEQQEAVRNSSGDLGTALNNIQQVGTGIAAGFSSVNAIMALTGSNSENLQKAMVKLQAGMALVQGLKGMEGMGKKMKALITSFKSMLTTTKAQTTANKALATSENTVAVATKGVSTALKGLKAALIATGVGALVVLLGTLIANLDKVGEWLGIVKNDTNEYEDANEKLNTSFEKQNKELDREITLMKASGESTQAVIKKKKELKQAQLNETLATIKNIEARNAQLEADKRWWKFWQNNGKQIKDNNEELKKLNETVVLLQEGIKDLDVEAQADILSRSRDAGKKAAEELKKTLKTVENDAKKLFKTILDEFKKTLKDIDTISTSVSTDKNIWDNLVNYFYGNKNAPKDLILQLDGISKGVASYAKDSLVKAFYDKKTELEAENKDNIYELKKELAEELYNALDDLFDDLPPFNEFWGEYIDDNGNVVPPQFDIVPYFGDLKTSAIEAAKGISESFTTTFNSLQNAYKQGLIDYKTFFASLEGLQKTYNEDLDKLRETRLETLKNDFAKGLITADEYISAVNSVVYAYSIKPLEFQKEVGERFMENLSMQIAAIEKKYNDGLTNLEVDLLNWEGNLSTWAGLFSTTITDRYKKQEDVLKKSHDLWMTQYHQEEAAIQEQLHGNMITVEQRAELWNRLLELDSERLLREAEFTEQSKKIHADWVHDIHDTVLSGIDEFAGLTSALNSLSQAQLKEYERQYEAGEITQEKYEELKKKSLEQQAALQIATTVMQTAAGIATVWAQAAQLGPIAGPIIAGIQTAAYLANAAAQIISIKTSLKQGLAGDTNGNVNAQAPDTSFTLQSTDAYQTELSDETQTDLQANAQQNQRVYVVSSDISNAQSNEKTTVTTATF